MKLKPRTVKAIKKWTSKYKLEILSTAVVAALVAGFWPSNTPESSVVMITNMAGNSGGTGFVTTNSKGTPVIITNDHVCGVAADELVRVEDSKGNAYIKRVVKHNFIRDLCTIEGIKAPAMTVAAKPAEHYDPLTVIGHPLLQPTSPSTGVFVKDMIIQLGMEPQPDGTCKPGSTRTESMFGVYCILSMEVGYTTVPIWAGNSGSPIVNSKGEVVGVINSADNRTNQGNYVPLPYLKEQLAD